MAPLAFVTAARALEAQGRQIARLDIGEPQFSTPPHIVDAAFAALRDGATKYVSPQGLPLLRAAIAAHTAERGIDASADDIVVTSGVKPMIVYALLAVAQAGDEVLVPDPGYPGYAAAARLAGATPRPYPLVRVADRITVDIDALERAITPASRVLVINSPHNPTGMIIDDATLQAIAEVAARHDLWIVSDEIYRLLAYDDAAPRSIAELDGMRSRTIVVDGFSKCYAMTGWRLGYAVLPRPLVASVTSIIGDASTCTPPFVQHAGVAALTGPQDFVGEMRHAYRARRDMLVQRLRAIPGLDIASPGGALYAFANIGALMDRAGVASSADVAMALLHDHNVACVPGAAFGARGERHLRFSFGVAEEQLEEGTRRFEQWAHRT
jgi:aspartate/methionine/tyrosine aminotransferase